MKCFSVKWLAPFCFAGILLLGSLSECFAQDWPNRPAGSTVITTNPLNDACSGVSGWTCQYNGGGTIVADAAPGAGGTPPNSLQYTQTASATENGGNYSVIQYRFPGNGATSVYAGFWMKFSDPYYGRGDVCQNKISLIHNEANALNPTGGKFYDLMAAATNNVCQNPPDKKWRLYGYMNYVQDESQTGAVGGTNIFGPTSVYMLQGQWTRIEICHIMSTTPSSRNGKYRVWVNGMLAVSYDNINHPGPFTLWSLNPVWDRPQIIPGYTIMKPGDQYYQRFDTVILATGFTTIGGGSSSTGIDGRQSAVIGSQLTAESQRGSVRFHLPQPGTFALSVYDLFGREMWNNAGSRDAVWSHDGNLKKGVYLVRAEQGGKTMNTNYCHVW